MWKGIAKLIDVIVWSAVVLACSAYGRHLWQEAQKPELAAEAVFWETPVPGKRAHAVIDGLGGKLDRCYSWSDSRGRDSFEKRGWRDIKIELAADRRGCRVSGIAPHRIRIKGAAKFAETLTGDPVRDRAAFVCAENRHGLHCSHVVPYFPPGWTD